MNKVKGMFVQTTCFSVELSCRACLGMLWIELVLNWIIAFFVMTAPLKRIFVNGFPSRYGGAGTELHPLAGDGDGCEPHPDKWRGAE